jgi:ABC-type transporter Mla subunit MlaD
MSERSTAERVAQDAFSALSDLAQALKTSDFVEEGRRRSDQARQQVESLVSTLKNVTVTLDNVHQLSMRVNALLDEIEEPIKKLAGAADQLVPLLAMLGAKPPATKTTSAQPASTGSAQSDTAGTAASGDPQKA